ncbi:MAG: hypothetical protein KF841_10325 [Phycisphaerae bacterium]|nr:hypothetical protein [Phycisphaerae bacterium]
MTKVGKHCLIQSQASPRSRRRVIRRASAMVFILGVLSLITLVGLALIVKTHGEAERITIQETASSEKVALEGTIATIQEILRRDIWGDPLPLAEAAFERPLSNDAPIGSDPNPILGTLGNRLGLRENNEPYDAPGEADRWLASNMPYLADPANLPPTTETNVLAWDHVSYIGSDILQPRMVTRIVGGAPVTQHVNPFVWAINSRNPADPELVRYDASSLDGVPIIQSPVDPGDLLPGSTTNVSIRNARIVWENSQAGGHLEALAAKLALPANAGFAADVVPQFPYFDTNRDGIVDLWDADGDGVPDSPLSLVIETDRDDANQPRRLYAAVRIVDHGGMLNVNTASSLRLPNGVLTFDETRDGLQRRGNRAVDFSLNGVVHRDDWLNSSRVSSLMDYRSNGVDPDVFDRDFIRRTLVGGLPDPSTFFLPFDLRDESSLRHRNLLVRYDRIRDQLANANDYRNIDRALRNTLLWSREISSVTDGTYAGSPRWARLNSNYEPPAATTEYEGYTNAGGAGWRQLLDEEQLFAVRKPMLTTVSSEVMMPPDIGLRTLPATGDSPIDRRLRQLWSLGMDWPVLMQAGSAIEQDPARPDAAASLSLIGSYILPATKPLPADWARVQSIDLNMASSTSPISAKADFIRYVAAATYLALEAGANTASFNYQGIPLLDTQAVGASLNRQWLAWQLAVNLADYRDADSAPTYWPWRPAPGEPVQYVIGVDRQPFFTEAFAFLTAGNTEGSGPIGTNPPPGSPGTPGGPPIVRDRWYYAFELFVPPGWNVSTANLYFRAPELGPDLIPLSAFRQQTATGLGAVLPAVLSGGPADIDAVTDRDHGNYYVFCNSLDDAPADIRARLTAFPRTYVYNGLAIDTSGFGRMELVYSPTGQAAPSAGSFPNHVLDVIGPQYSGGELADQSFPGTGANLPGTTDDFSWARRPSLTVMPEGGIRAFSLRRSTKGWRFTTAWHIYSVAPTGISLPRLANFDESLGEPNRETNQSGADIDSRIPESVWPAMTSMSGAVAEDDFVSGLPFAAFDSVADLSRMLMVGPVNLTNTPARPVLFDYTAITPTIRTGVELPATVLIAQTLTAPPSGNAPFGDSSTRVAAGRVDFVDAYRVGNPSQPWTWKLFDYLTVNSPLHDGIDNDGDGLIDFEADPTEAVDIGFRIAGRVNLNTAPATVLRAGPFMSLLPTSPQIALYNSAPINDPIAAFFAGTGFYYDLPSAIIAKRENRRTWLRLPDGTTGVPQVVAVAQNAAPGGGAGPGGGSGVGSATTRKPFQTIASLAHLTSVTDASGRDDLFRIDRYHTSAASGALLFNHIIPERDPTVGGSTNTHPRLGLDGSPYSPDFRFRPGRSVADYVPIETPALFVGDPTQVRSDPIDGAGIRGRDILLSRLTNTYTTRSDVFTAYIALIDEDGNYVHRSEVTLDRSPCFNEVSSQGAPRRPIMPQILTRTDGSYSDDTK